MLVQPQERVVDQRRRLDGDGVDTLPEPPAQVRERDPLQVPVDEPHELVHGPVPAGLDVPQQQRDVTGPPHPRKPMAPGGVRLTPVLERLLADPDHRLRMVAEWALEKIQGTK